MPRQAACSARHRGDQPRPGRPCGDRRDGSAATPALPRSATASRPPRWARCGYFLRAGRVLRHRRAADPGAVRAVPHPPARNRPAAGARRRLREPQPDSPGRLRGLLRHRPLLILAGCVALFHLANAAMLPLMGELVTMRSRMGDGADRRLHRGAAARGRAVLALGRAPGRRSGAAPAAAPGFAALTVRGAAVRARDGSVPCWSPSSCSTASPPPCSA